MAGGRPTDYTPELLEKARGYLDSLREDTYDEVSKTWDVDMPSIVGLAGYIGVARDTIHAWVKDEKDAEFSDIIKQISEKQEQCLTKGGVGGRYNPTISKLILGKHGYHDKVDSDVTTAGEKLNTEPTPAMVAANAAAMRVYEEEMRKSLAE